jgi:hypothetical protein
VQEIFKVLHWVADVQRDTIFAPTVLVLGDNAKGGDIINQAKEIENREILNMECIRS